MTITAEQLAAAIKQADDEAELNHAYIDDEDLGSAIIDGRVDLERVAEILNEKNPPAARPAG